MSDTLIITPPAPPAPPSEVVVKTHPGDLVPANWDLTPVEGSEDQILARNNATNRRFEGTVAEFNAFMKTL